MKLPIKTKREFKQTSVALNEDQIRFIKSNRINLSALVRELINQLIIESLEVKNESK